jgi:2-polyprenyl-6-methoxyphenol hydroxylase-like FAD-dependent oxidoreductase
MMAGLMLARAGIDVVVLEKHADFLRDFRGDTLHPSTLEVMHELGLYDELEKLPHQNVERLVAQIGDFETEVADLTHLPVRSPFIMMMPQWDFLDFLKRQGERYSNFRCLMSTEAVEPIMTGDRVTGLRARHPDGPIEIAASLVIAADGRRSRIREGAGLEVEDLGAPIDVLWFRLSRKPEDTDQTGGRFDRGRFFVRIFRGDYWQCAFVIRKGEGDAIRARGIEAFRAEVGSLLPVGADRANELESFDDVSLLSVSVDRLKRWYRPGLLCIGDAAHAMSPVGGVGINLAIQDAVAAANMLAAPLTDDTVEERHLAAVQKRRMLPTRLTQAAQVFVHRNVLGPALADRTRDTVPLPVRLLARYPRLRRIPARLIGLGVRPEHVRLKAAP